jgi:creatinine amidohydrolase
MPTDLAFKLAARQAIFAFLEKERGEGWWGDAKMANYYAEQAGGDDPFNWIKGHPLMTPDIFAEYPFDHAGQGETSLMMALSPEAVDMKRLSAKRWYTLSAGKASTKLGEKGRDMILAHVRQALGTPKSGGKARARRSRR